MKALLSLILVSLVSVAHATALTAVHYDPKSQQLHVSVVYQGGLKPHEFSLDWDQCQIAAGDGYAVHTIAARLVDTGWDDTGTEEIAQTISFDMGSMNCKPAYLTIRSGRVSHATVYLPY